jgi:putative tricarboxylic transport membrane protein
MQVVRGGDSVNWKKISRLLLTGTALFSLAFTVCGTNPVNAKAKYPANVKRFEFIAPAGAGGGWDLTIRSVAKVLQDAKLVKTPMLVANRPGGGGAVALSYLQQRKGNDSIIAVYSPPLLLIKLNGTTPFSYKNTTPLARLIADYACFVVAKNSKYQNFKDVMNALKKDPKSVKICGTSAAGSMDHLQFLKIAKAAGVTNLKQINYISFQDNTGAAQVLGGHVDLFSTGLAEVKGLLQSGDLRALASTADKRVGEGVLAQIPTCKEQGINATFVNWRGIFGPPGMPGEAVKFWEITLKKMSKTPQWKNLCKANGWDNIYANRKKFIKFLNANNRDYKILLKEVGMLK